MLLHPPYPFVMSRVISTALLTCYVSTCCNIDTLVFVSLRVSKIRFLGCIFGGAVLCIYYANEFSILPLFLSFFDSFYFVFISFLLPLFRLFWFVCFDSFLPLIHAICPIVFRAYCQPGRGGVTFDSLVNVPRYHVATLPRYRVATLIVVAGLKTYHVVKLLCGWSCCSCWGIHRRHRQLVVNTFNLTC